MVVAILTVHVGNGLLATTNGVELPLLYIASALCLALTGPGAYSIDAALGLSASWTPLVIAIVLLCTLTAAFGFAKQPAQKWPCRHYR